jgi:putative ABC transport system permease protein
MTAFLAPNWAEAIGEHPNISMIYVSVSPGQAESVRSVLAATVNPGEPSSVQVSQVSDLLLAQQILSATFIRLSLSLSGVALLVGMIGIANTMVVAVMERRQEIGLRRALGARKSQIVLQFVIEAGLVGLVGGACGLALGVVVVLAFALGYGFSIRIPLWVVVLGPVVATLIGTLAGLRPAVKAARQPPTTVLHSK